MFSLDGFVEFLETFELRGETAFGGCVDDEDDFAFVGGQGVGVSFLCFCPSVSSVRRVGLMDGGRTVRRREIVESSCGGHCAVVIESDEAAL